MSDQKKTIEQTEELQDFQRDREGHVILCFGRPLLIVSFGEKRKGKSFKVEGKFWVPVNYKAILKFDEDEICFMTRESKVESTTGGPPTLQPEFQIIYLPKSALADDFKVFDWNPDVKSVWNPLIESILDKNVSSLSKGPWYVFGISDDVVQTAIDHAVNEKQVDGILYCADGVSPSLQEVERYLQMTESDRPFGWIASEFLSEPLPSQFFPYVSSGMAYWVDSGTQTSTWKHPLFEKYTRLLKLARLQRPLSHPRAIAEFQIEALYLENSDSTEMHAISELARIFKVDLKIEPFLVHVLRKANLHFSTVVKEKMAVKDVDDFHTLIKSAREAVAQYKKWAKIEAEQTELVRKCVECDPEGPTEIASIYCENCGDLFCVDCFTKIHSTGRRQNHKRTILDLGKCAECDASFANLHCLQCQDEFCGNCFLALHQRGGRRTHVPVCLLTFNPQRHKFTAANFAQSVTVGIGGSGLVESALSPWLRLTDDTGMALFWNLKTSETRRDLPLGPLNVFECN